MQVTEVNVQTGERTERPMTPEEMANTPPYVPQQIKILSSLQFRDRFTLEEKLAIRAAAMTDHVVGLFYDESLAADFIDLDDPRVEQGVDLYISKGLVDSSRKTEILSPSMTE